METLATFFTQAKQIWHDSTAAARLGIALLVVICLGAIIGIGIWSAQPNYVLLANDLTPGQATRLIESLEKANYSYDIEGGGSIILVDKQHWSRAKILLGNLGVVNQDNSLADDSPFMDPVSRKNVFRHNLERNLEASIEIFENIESAKVHLSIPERQTFLRESAAPSAAVIVQVARNYQFNESHAMSIARTVASSVSGLDEKDVAISDNNGNEYIADGAMGQLSKQDENRINRERHLASQAQKMLKPFLGEGNFSVAITQDLTYETGTITSEEFDEDNKVMMHETTNTTTKTDVESNAQGVPGSDTNLGGGVESRPLRPTVLSKTVDGSIDYSVPKERKMLTSWTPDLKIMTVSVVVNESALSEDIDRTKLKKQIEGLVGQAVGFRPDRDQITVELFEFVQAEPVPEPVAAPFPWEQINEILKNISLGIAALVAAYIAMRAFRKFTPASSENAELTSADTQIDQLTEMLQENPEVFSQIIASWSNSEPDDANSNSESRAA